METSSFGARWAEAGSRLISHPVQRAGDAEAAPVQDVGVDHGRRDVAVAEKLLDRADVGAALEKLGREGVAQRVAARGFADARLAHGALDENLAEVAAAPAGQWRAGGGARVGAARAGHGVGAPRLNGGARRARVKRKFRSGMSRDSVCS